MKLNLTLLLKTSSRQIKFPNKVNSEIDSQFLKLIWETNLECGIRFVWKLKQNKLRIEIYEIPRLKNRGKFGIDTLWILTFFILEMCHNIANNFLFYGIHVLYLHFVKLSLFIFLYLPYSLFIFPILQTFFRTPLYTLSKN